MSESFGSECKPPTESDLAGWQPVRIAPPQDISKHHNRVSRLERQSAGKVVRARPTALLAVETLRTAKLRKCNAVQYYEIHPDDVVGIWGIPNPNRLPAVVCEHQIQAD